MIIDFEQFNKPLHKIIDSTQVQYGNLYVGGYNATKKEILENLKINAVLTAARDTGLYFKDRQHLVIDALDDDEYKLDRHFRKSIDFIDKNLNTTNVLVHCFAGVSRSVTIVAAYLIFKKKMTAAEAIKYIQSIRQIAGPNEGFIQQLEKFEKKQ